MKQLDIIWTWFRTPIQFPGGIQIEPLGIVELIVVLILLWWGARWLRKATRILLSRRLDPSLAYAISRIGYYIVLVFGVLIALQSMGVNLSSLSILGGVVGVGLGFGLQNIFSNFASGLILLMEQSIKVGDYIQIKENGLHGAVVHLGVRYTQVRTNDNIDILVPNSQFVNGDVINWSLSDSTMRLHIPFRVPYGTDREALRELVIAAAHRSEHTLNVEGKKPSLWISAFGEAGYDCEMIVWVDRYALMRPGSTRAEYHWLLAEALDQAGIEVPRPRQEISFARPDDARIYAEAVSRSSSST
ncbi:mechanosensitive ion channel family protein [Acidithiobacillus sp. IBUN Pt1247-S3]|uniref:mechanosensitive ion channel family protein n=1 Tax=Acidithiobacillus sp. IBUN Pt1247-S3 TaxID=3166642 RepID=UPI0034E485DA